MFQALDDYFSATPDPKLLRDLYPTLSSIIHAHAEGTRFGIRVDEADGLLFAGEAGTQLTWMDAKHGDTVFTPRIGKPVEINALWLNALNVMVRWSARLRNVEEKRFCDALLARATAWFQSLLESRGRAVCTTCSMSTEAHSAMRASDPIKSWRSPCPIARCRSGRCAPSWTLAPSNF